jgi:hypothetical protein
MNFFEWVQLYIAIFISLEVPLTILLIRYYRRFWTVIKALGLETAPSTQAKTEEMFKGVPQWWMKKR